jgi:5'-3' exonuclease
MIALIDSDTLAYASAATAEGQGAAIACWNANKMVEDILRKLNVSDYQLYLTGDSNFRYQIYPEYKANRLKTPRPTLLPDVVAHLIREWGAFTSEGGEADDDLGIQHTKNNENGVESILVSIDKDLQMIPGWNFNPKRDERVLISPTDAIRFFYYQLLVGDTADNIKGAPGIGKVKANRALEGLSTETELLSTCRDYYGSDEALEMNARCLWIARYKLDEWRLENIDTTISEETDT